jgi:hypothetical protein
MENKNPRKLSSTVLGLLIIFSALATVNFVSTNVRADPDQYWSPGHNVTGTEEYEDCTITMRNGNLTIFNGGTLVFNDGVTFEIWNPIGSEHKYGIIIESNGTFRIDSSLGDSEIVSDPSNPDHTYHFTNSGTLDFTGATA